MKYLRSLLLSVALIIIFGVTVHAAPSKPTVPKTLGVSEGFKEQFAINPNGWEIQSVKTKVSKKGMAEVTYADNLISVSGIKEGKTVLTTIVKATKSEKTKTFKLKTKVTILHTDELIPFDVIAEANSHDNVFARHSNFLSKAKACNDTAAGLIGARSADLFCNGNEAFLSRSTCDITGKSAEANFLVYMDEFTDFGMYENKPETIGCMLYAMPDAVKKEYRTALFTDPCTTNPIVGDHCFNEEETNNVRKVKNELVVTTFAETAYVEPYSSSIVKIEYYLDPSTYEVHKINTFYHTPDKDYPFTSSTFKYDVEMPFDTTDLVEYAKYFEKGDFADPQTFTITYIMDDESLPDYKFLIDKSMLANIVTVPGFNLFTDKEGLEPFNGVSLEDNVQLFAIYSDAQD